MLGCSIQLSVHNPVLVSKLKNKNFIQLGRIFNRKYHFRASVTQRELLNRKIPKDKTYLEESLKMKQNKIHLVRVKKLWEQQKQEYFIN